MIKEFKQTFKIELTDAVAELVAIRIQPGSRPLHRSLEDCLILHDRWIIQVIYRRSCGQQGLVALEKTMIFEARLPWQQAFPRSVQIDYVRRPYCLSYKIDQTVLCLTLGVLVELDLDLLPVIMEEEAGNWLDIYRRIQNLEACLGLPVNGPLHEQ